MPAACREETRVFPRIILTAETAQPQLAELCQVIKVGGVGDGGWARAHPVLRLQWGPVPDSPCDQHSANRCDSVPELYRPLPQPHALCVCGVRCLQVPPLRVRPRDISSLQRFFLHELQKQRANLGGGAGGGGSQVQLTPDAVRQLEAYSYPLNITELRTMVERAATQVWAGGGGGWMRVCLVWWWGKDAIAAVGSLLVFVPHSRALLNCAAATAATVALQAATSGTSLTEDVFWFAQQARPRCAALQLVASLAACWPHSSPPALLGFAFHHVHTLTLN